jgi:hypothetical protein
VTLRRQREFRDRIESRNWYLWDPNTSYPKGKKLSGDVMEGANAFGRDWQVLVSEPITFHSIERGASNGAVES